MEPGHGEESQQGGEAPTTGPAVLSLFLPCPLPPAPYPLPPASLWAQYVWTQAPLSQAQWLSVESMARKRLETQTFIHAPYAQTQTDIHIGPH